MAGSNELSEESAPTVGAWYHLFYSLDPGSLSTGGWHTVKKWNHPLPVGGPYDCADEKTIERQVKAMKDVGIRFIVFDHTNTVHVDNGQIDARIRKWYDWMDKQPENSRLLLTIAAGGELNQHSNREAWREASEYLWQKYANRPSHARLNVECMTVTPGWHRGDDKGGGIPRLVGQHYTKGWLAILKASPRYVLVGSWNEWGELTAIEDSDGWRDRRGHSCPDYYMKMTKGYIAAAGGKLLRDYCYQNEGDAAVRKWTTKGWRAQGQAPNCQPVVVLPTGWQPKP